jgi:hypothetical protein
MSVTPRLAPVFLLLGLATSACGASVTSSPADDAGAPMTADVAVTVTPRSPSCAEVRATCGAAPQQLVRGHAAGLAGLEGARVRFAMRYVREQGRGLDVPHGVVVATTEVRDGAFEACVCMPEGANAYPQIAAVVFAPGAPGETGRDVARATFSQRYATLGDEDESAALTGVPQRAEVEAALAGLVERTRALRVTGLPEAAGEGFVHAGLVAAERPVAAQVVAGVRDGAATAFDWTMPGRAWPTERVAIVVDRNHDRRCGEGDLGLIAAVGERSTLDLAGAAWSEGAALGAACAAVGLDASRER